MVGRSILHYRILEKLGEGGMGQVYKAQDTRLDRTVALKLISTASDTDANKQRFAREAHTAASLNHPNIAYVFNIEDDEAQSFITMEFVEGKTVQQLLSSGRPLPIKTAIEYAIQTATGLHAAHQKCIIHRDIKSANIMITPNDQVKIMDFGLAKLMNTTKVTQIGMRMGTVAYMSPEQAEGADVDYRSDIWSLGVVLYEMICGQLPFRGEGEQAMIYSILNEEPLPLTGLRTGVAMELERIVLKMLEKNPDDRYQHADELIADLRVLFTRYNAFVEGSSQGRHVGTKTLSLASVIALPLLTLFAMFITIQPWQQSAKSEKPILRFTIDAPAGTELVSTLFYRSLDISPDGRRIALGVKRNNENLIYIQNLDESGPVRMTDTHLCRMPAFSPDGNSLAFVKGDTVKVKPLDGGVTKTAFVAPDINVESLHWYDKHAVLLDLNDILNVNVQSSSVDRFTHIPHDSLTLGVRPTSPQMLPDRKAILATLKSVMEEQGEVVLFHLTSNKVDTLIKEARYARYVPTGHLVYAHLGDLYAVEFDTHTCTTSGPHVRVVENVAMRKSTAQFAVSENGTLVYATGGDIETYESQKELVWVDREGNIEPLPLPVGDYSAPRLSPDETKLAYWRGDRYFVYDFKTHKEQAVSQGQTGVSERVGS